MPSGEATAPELFATCLGRVLVVALVVGGLAALVTVNRLEMLPTLWIAGLTAAGLAAVGGVGLGLWLTKAPPSWARFTALALVALLGISLEAVALKASWDVSGFFEDVAPQLPTRGYSVIALDEHDSTEESLQGATIGELTGDPNREGVETHLREKFSAEFATCGDQGTLTQQLTAGRFEAAVMDSSIYAAYEEADNAFFDATQVLYTFDITTALVAPTPPTDAAEIGEPFLVYISGIDTSGPISSVSRSDVNMLMAVNPNTGQILLVNTPRDYYVKLHGYGPTKDKLTHAGIYGVQESIDTLQDLYGVQIDYYARVNFSSLIKMVDLVGGIDVNSPQAFTTVTGQRFAQGLNHLDGKAALAFSRERKAFAEGDQQRGKNQQLVIEALIAKGSQRSNLLRYNELLGALADAMEMNVPRSQISNLVKQLLDSGGSWNVQSMSVDGEGASEPTYSMGSMKLYVMIPDQASVDAATTKLKEVLRQ